MRHWVAVGAVCALLGQPDRGAAQYGSLGPPGSTNNLPAAMPGQVVGTTLNLKPAGTAINRAVPARADIKKLENPFMRQYDPSKPYDVFKGTNIDPHSVVAPVAGFPGTGQDTSLFERLANKLGAVTNFFHPSAPQRPTYTPGLSRRNKQRMMDRTWRRD